MIYICFYKVLLVKTELVFTAGGVIHLLMIICYVYLCMYLFRIATVFIVSPLCFLTPYHSTNIIQNLCKMFIISLLRSMSTFSISLIWISSKNITKSFTAIMPHHTKYVIPCCIKRFKIFVHIITIPNIMVTVI
jgi:hypothetical protein